MAYRQDEQSQEYYRIAYRKMTEGLPPELQEAAGAQVARITRHFGPVVDAYPVWHPFITAAQQLSPFPASYIDQCPSQQNGYYEIDHPVFFRDAVLAVVYDYGLEDYLSALQKLVARHNDSLNTMFADLTVLVGEELGPPLYNEKGTPVLLCCTWDNNKNGALGSPAFDAFIEKKPVPRDGQEIPLSYIMRNTMAWFMKMAESSQIAEDWKNISSYVLGSPCGAVSSPFITEEVGFRLRSLARALNDSGLFGPRLVYADDPEVQKHLVSSGRHATVSKID
jgi:hypothetical protein